MFISDLIRVLWEAVLLPLASLPIPAIGPLGFGGFHSPATFRESPLFALKNIQNTSSVWDHNNGLYDVGGFARHEAISLA